jgi:hypothetical protein
MRASLLVASLGILLAAIVVPGWADEPAEKAVDKPVVKRPTLRLPAIPLIQIRAAIAPAEEPAPAEPAAASHETLKTVEVRGESGATLQTLTATTDGKIVCLVGPGRHAPVGTTTKPAASEIRVLSSDGAELKQWKLSFTGHSVGAGPDGSIYAAGDGHIARFSADGKLLAETDLPHLAEAMKSQDALRKQAEEQLKAQAASLASSQQVIAAQVKRLEDKGDAATDLEKKQLVSYRNYLKTYTDRANAAATPAQIDAMVKSLTSRMRIINAIAPTENEVYIACGEMKGYGYAIWRMDTSFKNAKQILSGIPGCCGQMDVQADASGIYLAENTKKRVAHYDREGKEVSAFGTSGRESSGLSFGGCCNPMNCRVCSTGEILTAESEGIVKRFNAKGEFLGLVGYAKLTGGCKNVAVAASPKTDRVYFCDLPGSRVIILAAKKTEVAGE